MAKGYEVLKIGKKEYNTSQLVKNFDEIVDYFSKSKKTTPDLSLYNKFIDMLWRSREYDWAIFAVKKAREKYPQDYNLEEKMADIFLDAKKYDSALSVFERLKEKYTHKYHIPEGLGYALLGKGDLDNALDNLMEALEMKTWDPTHLMAQFSMVESIAKIYYLKEEYSKALEFLDEILTVQPKGSKWRLYIKILEKMGKEQEVEEARRMYEDVKKAKRYASRAYRYEVQGKYELALKNYQKAIDLNPHEPHYYFNVAHVLESLPEDEYEFQYEEATEYYRTAYEMFPNNPFYALSYVGNLINTNRWEDAFSLAEQVSLKFPEIMLPNLRFLSENLGYEKKFLELLEKIASLDPQKELSEIRTELALLLKDLGKEEEAKKWFLEASEIYKRKMEEEPYNWRHYYDYALCYLEMDDLEKSRENLIKALEYHGDFSVDIGEKLAHTLYKLEMYEDARLILEALVVSNPRDPEYLGMMGFCFMAEGEYEKAFEAFNRSLLLNRDEPEYLYCAGVCAVHLNREKDALNIVQDLLDMEPSFVEVIEKEPTFLNMKLKNEFQKIIGKYKAREGIAAPSISLKKINIETISKKKK